MKRLAVLVVLAALTSLALAVSAQARSVVAKRVGQSRADVTRYWTDARMRAALPIERARPGGGGGSPTYPFTPFEVPGPYTSFPTSTNGKVFFTEGSTNYVCSGTALTSVNASVVWTAGHCVNAGPGAFHTNWMFAPAYRDGASPLGRFTATTLLTTEQWRAAGSFAYDLGAAVVGSIAGQSLTSTTGGGRAITFNGPRNQSYTAYGYPAAKKFSGQRLRGCASSWAFDDTSVTPNTMAIGCDMTGGSSGGAWITTAGALASVNSYGYGTLRNVMFGPYQGTVAESLYGQASATSP